MQLTRMTCLLASYGTILANGDGRTLYLFTKEPSSKSRCFGACAQAWPPFLSKGKPRAGRGAKAQLLGSTERSDGSAQVTYRGHRSTTTRAIPSRATSGARTWSSSEGCG